MKLKVVIERGEDSGFIVHIPALPGCRSQGETRDEALANIREAAEGWLETQEARSVDRAKPNGDIELITL